MAAQSRGQHPDITQVRERAGLWPVASVLDVGGGHAQDLMPMALYRPAGSVHFARAAEWPGRAVGLTRVLGSPVIVRADRGPLD